MSVDTRSRSIVQESLLRWDLAKTGSQIERYLFHTEDSPESRIGNIARLIPLYGSSGNLDQLQQLASLADQSAIAIGRPFAAALVHMQCAHWADNYERVIELRIELLEMGQEPSLELRARSIALSALRILVRYEELVTEATQILSERPGLRTEFQTRIELGCGLFEIQLFDSAEEQLNRALELASNFGGGHWYCRALIAIAACKLYRERSQPGNRRGLEEATDHLRTSIEALRLTTDYALLAYAQSQLCTALLMHEEVSLETLRQLAQESYATAERSRSGRIIAIACVVLGDILFRDGNYTGAGKYFTRALPLIDYPFHYSGLLDSSMIGVAAATGHPEAAVMHRLSLERSLYSWSKRRLEAVESYEQHLKAAELERQEREYAMGRQILEDRLSSTTLQLLSQTDLLNSIRRELLTLVRRLPSSEPVRPLLQERLRSLPCKSVDWHRFDVQFAAAHPEFIRKLMGEHPVLSPSEVRICCLVRMSLTSDDIASLLCLSSRTVENHRYRIRSKIGIGTGEDLVTALMRY